MPFPDERDRNIIRRAEQVENLATDLCDWLSEYNPARRRTELLPVNESDEFEVLQLRRLAGSLYTSSKVPVAAAAYGASQVGKSLFMGQVLRPQSENYCPIGGDETLGEPAYYKNLSFDNDLNPQCGSQEATALVTRFTTKDRIGAGVSPQYPVMVRALTRAEWLRVLARGFHAECKTPATTWQQAELETLFEDLARKFPDQQVDRKWRMDILDAFSYMRAVDRRGFQATEAVINGLLSRYPLSEDGYVAAAAALFWDNWPTLTALFVKIANFLKRITLGNHDPAIFCHWAGVRFLLDSQRSKVYERPNSKIWNHVAWSDIYLTPKEKYFVLEYRPNSGMGTEELETIQAGMLELVMPVLPHRLSEEWRKVIEQMDFLDVPGMRAVRTGIEQGKRTSADTLEEQMEIVKRGKVSYLFERFVDELQIQTLFLLLRGGNLEVKAQMKYHVEKWGRARYGEKVWPLRVQDEIPALFIGMSGLDEEFRNREIFAEKILYDTRLNSILDTLGNVLTDFGGKGKPFTNVYPIRYPGTWDTNEEQRQADNPEKWDRARKAFLESELVKTYVRDPALRWDTAMKDGDGGQSLISMGIRAVTSADAKQDQLTKEIGDVQNRLLQLSRDWVVDPDTNIDRERRVLAAKKVVDWLTADEERIYHRVHALEESLCMAEGEELQIADCADNANRRHGDPLPKELKNYLHEWATVAVPKRWETFCNSHQRRRAVARSQRHEPLHPLPPRLPLDRQGLRPVGRAGAAGGGTEDPRRGGPPPRPAEVRPHHPQRLRDEPRPQPGPAGDPGGGGQEQGQRRGGFQPFRPDGVVRQAMGQAPAAGPGPGGRRAHQAPAGEHGADPHSGAVREEIEESCTYFSPTRGSRSFAFPCAAAAATRPTRSVTAGSAAPSPRAAANDPPRTFPYIQWQIIQSGTTRLFLAVDTSCGDPEVGYFCSPNSLTRDFLVNLQGLLDIDGKPLKGVPDIDLCIRPAAATAGDAKHVHMIIDFGNSRTGVLLLELAGEISQTPQMLPFELTNRYHLDAWNEEGEFVSQPAARWFSSKTHWCNTPYLPPLEQKKTDYHTVGEEDGKRGWFGRGGKSRQAKVEMVVTPPLFDDLSMVRMGREADDVVQVMRAEGDIRTGRELAQALPLGRRRELAGRGQLAHGRSHGPLQDRRLRLAAEGSLPQVRPRGRPRLPPAGKRAQGERVRRRGPAEAAARAPRADDGRALRDAWPRPTPTSTRSPIAMPPARPAGPAKSAR